MIARSEFANFGVLVSILVQNQRSNSSMSSSTSCSSVESVGTSAVTRTMANDTRLRPARQDDADKIADLEMLLFPENCWNERTLGDLLEQGKSWVAEENGEILGYAIISDDNGIADLLRLGVRSKSRRQGIGRCLMEFGLGKRPAVLMVKAMNPAIALYRQCGFRVVGTLDGAWTMRRP
jgi:ribosomal protein S18 acetylase RimI-like enzyme